jgi:hypothetical protein
MGVINVENLEPGMLLASDVKDRGGRVLLTAGQEITEKHLRIFRMWGVTDADVQGVEMEEVASKAASSVDPQALLKAEEHMKWLFQQANTDNPFMKELLRLVTLRAARKTEGDDGNSE